jgi:hypothetical protein
MSDVVKEAALGNFGLPLSVPFQQCSVFVFILNDKRAKDGSLHSKHFRLSAALGNKTLSHYF